MNIYDTHTVAIVTKWHGPTDYKGSRVIAKRGDHTAGDPTYTHHWNYALDTHDNHVAAVKALADKLGWADDDWAIGTTSTGVVAVRLPREVRP